MKPGQKFQQDFKNSLSPLLTCVRLNDSREGLNHERCVSDYLIYNGQNLHAVELKTHLGESIQVGEKQAIKTHQIEGLVKFQEYPNCHSWFIINFREHKNTYRILASNLQFIIKKHKKKSITMEDCRELGFIVPEDGDKFDLSYFNPTMKRR